MGAQPKGKDVLVGVETISRTIFLIRGRRVMLDRHLAQLYGVKTRRLREQVKRNLERFPDDFMLQLTEEEALGMVSQFATPSAKMFGGHRPYAFTQEGAAMLSGILRSPRAVELNIRIMRAFVRLRELAGVSEELRGKFAELERRMDGHDSEIKTLFDAIRGLMPGPGRRVKRIGFRPP